nr:unnamed protein product [Callosobruchus analis]
MASELNGLQSKIKSVAPQTLFTHCYAHALNLVLSKACNINKHARIFFSNLTGFSAFFSKSTKRTKILNEICSAKLPSNAATRWNFISRAVFTVFANKQSLIEVFNFINNNDSFKNDNHTIREAVGLRNHMQDSKICFLLQKFNLIFAQTDVVLACFQNKLTNLKNELLVIYNDLQMFEGCTTQNQILEFMYKNELYECLSELYKLLNIIVTIPVTSVSVERSFSALKRIKTYTRNTMDQNRLSNIALISIEKPLLNLLSKNEAQFYDKIIDHFANSTNCRIPHIYKAET